MNQLNLGRVLVAPFPVQLWPDGPVREPDVLFIGRDKLPLSHPTRFEGAPDLVVEIVSTASVTLDRITKFREYEQAGIFWSQVVPGFRIPLNRLWLVGPQNELPDIDLPLAEMLADAPGLPDDLRAAYRQLAQLLKE